jgi:hypothetical protein
MVPPPSALAAGVRRTGQRVPDDVQLEVLPQQVLVVQLFNGEIPDAYDGVIVPCTPGAAS